MSKDYYKTLEIDKNASKEDKIKNIAIFSEIFLEELNRGVLR